MPFTVAHIAAVLPARRWCTRSGQFSALAIGTMMPDLPYFIGGAALKLKAHSLHSLLWWSAPVGLLIWWFWHAIAKFGVAACLTPQARSAVAMRGLLCPPEIGRVQAAALCAAGALTHIVWDGFTHVDGFGVQWFPVLATPALQWHPFRISWYFALQIICSLIGLAAMLHASGRSIGVAPWRASAWWGTLEPAVRLALLQGSVVPITVATVVASATLHDIPDATFHAVAFVAFTASVGFTLMLLTLLLCAAARSGRLDTYA
jgi:hypothetical protein